MHGLSEHAAPHPTTVVDSEPPHVLVDVAWCLDRLDDPGVRVVQVDERPGRGRFEQGHIPGSVSWIWDVDLVDPVRYDVASREQLTDLLERSGIDATTHVVLYGDPSNWFAAWAYWLLKLYDVPNVSLLDGGRSYWVAQNLPLTTDLAAHARTTFVLPEPSIEYRAFRADVVRALADGGTLVDARSPREYSGELLAPPGRPETAVRAGHIPGAISIPWDEAVNPDGTFKSVAELKVVYDGARVAPGDDIIVYCKIGERSSHSWFVLHELLGYPRVRNYDGSWTEWGSSVGLPIER
jgi:thiosulfate/3-mercaptopyruvate sulfurtransferase